MLVQVLTNRSPIPAPMYRAQATRGSDIHPFSVPEPRLRLLQRRITMAEHDQAHVAQAMFDMLHRTGTVRHNPDADDIETMHLVDHRDSEGSVRGSKVGEAVGRGVLRAPFVVRVQ